MEFQFKNTMPSLKPIADAFNVEIYERNTSTGKGIIICIGSGLLMATMDMMPSAFCAIEFDVKNRANERFVDFLSITSHWADYIFVHAWFSITKPIKLIEVLKVVPEDKLYWKSNKHLGHGKEFKTLKEVAIFFG